MLRQNCEHGQRKWCQPGMSNMFSFFFFGGFKSTVHEKVLRGMCYVPALFDKNIPSQVLWNLASHQALTSKYKGTGTWLNHVESKNQRLQMTKSGHRCLAGWLHPLSLQCTSPPSESIYVFFLIKAHMMIWVASFCAT